MLRCFTQVAPSLLQGICCFVRITRNCTSSCRFVHIVLFRDFEALKVTMRNPVDVSPHTCEIHSQEHLFYVYFKNKLKKLRLNHGIK